ncbi:TMEM175 family protein [Nocardia sp. NPDC005978]|uniref:TMEM175 family protein n=1 Tax=Nocardia sp. NPDC005978 TaxID=3156725 RepID=UPI0033BBA687
MEAEKGLERLVNFSDAVVAIAATLLVLPLVDVVEDAGDTGLREIFVDHRGDLVAFVVSFAVIYRLWLLHHRLFRTLRGYNTALLWTNLLWLMSIVFLPVPTKLISSGDGFGRDATALYLGTIAIALLALLIQRCVIAASPALRGDVTDPSVLSSVIAAGTAVVAFALGLVFPQIGLWFLMLFVVSGPLGAAVENRWRSSAGRQSV